MFKQVKIIVWTAFFCWMAFFVFSLNQAEAATVGFDTETVQNQLKLYKSDVCKMFLPSDIKNGEAAEKCNESSLPQIPKAPITRAEVKSLLFEITENLCVDGHTDQSKVICWHAADLLLSGNIPLGAHGFCRTHKSDEGAESCYAQAFAQDASAAYKAAAATSTIQGKNEALLRDYGRALCHSVNHEHDAPDIFWGITADHSTDCDKTAAAMIDDSKAKGQIPSDDLQIKAYEAGLSVHVCTAQNVAPLVDQVAKWAGIESKNPAPQRLSCFQAADGLYGGVPEAPLPANCTQEQLRMAVPSYLGLRESFSLTGTSMENYVAKFTPGAECYQTLFTNAATDLYNASYNASYQSQAVQNQNNLLQKLGSQDQGKQQ